jgi:hypothetical protein
VLQDCIPVGTVGKIIRTIPPNMVQGFLSCHILEHGPELYYFLFYFDRFIIERILANVYPFGVIGMFYT